MAHLQHLIEETDELWKALTERKYKTGTKVSKRDNEKWRDCYAVRSPLRLALMASII